MKKAVSIGIAALLLLLIAIMAGYGVRTHRASDREGLEAIAQWRILWGDGSYSLQQAQAAPAANWLTVTGRDALPQKPPSASSAWVQVALPEFDSNRYGIYIPELYAQNVTIYVGGEKVEEMRQRHPYDVRRILLPLHREDSGRTLYLKIDTTTERIGIAASIWFGPYDKLLPMYVTRELDSVAIGFALIFIALVMLICSIFLQRTQRPAWISLGVVILTLGSLNVTYSTFSYAFYGEYGEWFVDLFDLSLDVFLPVMTYFFEQVFGDGKRRLLYKFRQLQTAYSAACVLFMIVNHASGYRFASIYFTASVTVTGFIMLAQMVLLIGTAAIYALRKNKDALIFSSGVVAFALMAVADLALFYKNGQSSQFYLWRWGLVIFVISLIVILGRRLAVYQELIVKYSKETELYHQRLQNSEKMETISALAASVAHEVRNPLQVTRGFLQLTADKADDRGKYYMKLAIEELDRASGIISDFLTFAKPQVDEISKLNVLNELKQIEVMTVPLASMHGGDIFLNVPQGLYIQGNSSKFKQAFINLVKNSIEALREQGNIHIWAYRQSSDIVIHIRDNGEGIDPDVLDKLGKPYMTTKSKGTGLGLMVTFRIIELMKGQLEFKSRKGEGTEAIVRFPAAVD